MLKRVYFAKNGEYKINENVYQIGIIDVNNKIKNLIIGENVRSILDYKGSAIENIVFNNKLQEIYGSAFENSKLVNIEFPSSLTYINSSAFSNCNDLKSVTFNSWNFDGIFFLAPLFSGCKNIKRFTFNIDDISKTINFDNYIFDFASRHNNEFIINCFNDIEKLKININKKLDIRYEYILTKLDQKFIKNNTLIFPNKYDNIKITNNTENSDEKILEFDTVDFSYIKNGSTIEIENMKIKCKKIILPDISQNKKFDIHCYISNDLDDLKIEIKSNSNQLDVSNLLHDFKYNGKIYNIISHKYNDKCYYVFNGYIYSHPVQSVLLPDGKMIQCEKNFDNINNSIIEYQSEENLKHIIEKYKDAKEILLQSYSSLKNISDKQFKNIVKKFNYKG